MKIFVFSDSHGDVLNMADVIQKGRPDMVFHLGDHIVDALEIMDMYTNLPLHSVKGNTDFYGPNREELLLELCGKRLLLAHGHLYGVKMGMSRYRSRARELNADIALYGHTHVQVLEMHDKTLFMNPGRAGRFTRNTSPVSYGVLHVEEGKEISARIVTL